jgi:molybdopterin converting factor small subunit
VRISFYGRLAETIGREVDLDVGQACAVGEVRSRLAGLFPHAASDIVSPRVRACVGDRIVPDSFVVAPGESVDILAPLSGG